MSIVRSIEVIAQSPQGFDQACQEAIKEASRTLRGSIHSESRTPNASWRMTGSRCTE
jgi:hypothetical protein